MEVRHAIAEILKRENVTSLLGYPINPLFDAAAALDIRTIIVRQERIGVHMADAFSRMRSGRDNGVFTMQHGPGAENSFGAIAQAFSESVPIVIVAGGHPRDYSSVFPSFSALVGYRDISKRCEQVTTPSAVPAAMRRAFSAVRNGRPGPAVVEIPLDLWTERVPEPLRYDPVAQVRSAPDPADVDAAAKALVGASRPVIYAGQGVHYARAWDELKELAELLGAPVTTSLEGKSAFPETHPLSLGSGGQSMPGPVYQHLRDSDLIFGIGASFGRTKYGLSFPADRVFIHGTNDPSDISKDIQASFALVGDAQLTLASLVSAIKERAGSLNRTDETTERISMQRQEWMQKWISKLTSNEIPLSPYRVIWDLMKTVDVVNSVITHDAGSPRDQLSPFWAAVTPLSYIGWGKTTQLGYGLGLAMGAKLANPEKLCINVWGDAAIGMTGMDFETAVREGLPILSILLNNFSMAVELSEMEIATERYRATDISGNYADFATALGGYGERVTTPTEIVPAIRRGVEATQEGRPALLEFITQKETEISTFPRFES